MTRCHPSNAVGHPMPNPIAGYDDDDKDDDGRRTENGDKNRCVMCTDGIQSLRPNYVSLSRPYLGMMPWCLSEARAPSCRPWPLYLAKMWPRERTKVIMVNLVSRRRTMAVLSSLSTSVSVALLTLKMYLHSVSIFFLLI